MVDFISPDLSGRVKAEEILNKVTDKTLVVSVMHITCVFGEPDGDKIVQKGVYAKMARE